jgi:DNA-binding transcriptional LysR family regulator
VGNERTRADTGKTDAKERVEVDPKAKELTLQRARLFLTAIDLGTIAKAAEVLGLPETTASEQLQSLGKVFGPLLKQYSKGESFKLTPRDRAVERYLREMVRLYERACEETREEPRRIRIGCNRIVRPAVVAALTNLDVCDADGKFEVLVEELDTEEQVERLRDGRLTVAVSYTTPKLRDETHFHGDGKVLGRHRFQGVHLLRNLRCDLVVPRAAVRKEKLDPSELDGLTYLALPKGNVRQFRCEADAWLKEQGVAVGRVIETKRASTIVSSAAVGSSFGFLPQLWRGTFGEEAKFYAAEGLTLHLQLTLYVERPRYGESSRWDALWQFRERLPDKINDLARAALALRAPR